MDRGEGVVLTVVSGAPEADVVCGLLRTAGIDCADRDTEAIDSTLEDFHGGGSARDPVGFTNSIALQIG